MKTIILGFSRPKKLSVFAKLIMWSDSISYDHVYVKWSWDKIERDVIYQASKMAVNFESNITFDKHAIVIEEYEITLDEECYKKVMQFCMDNSNKPYGFKEIIGFAWMKALGFCGEKVSNPFPSANASWICSKIGAALLIEAGYIGINQSIDDIDPLLLNQIVNSLGLKRIT